MALPILRMRVIMCSVASALVLAGSSSRLSAQPPSSPRIASDSDVQGAQRLFSAWLEGQMLERGLPGVAVGVVADQELVWAAGFGFADSAARIPMTPQIKFRMASHSKLFTATAVMQLREQGKLRLDDPVAKYLPWFTVKPAESDDPRTELFFLAPDGTMMAARIDTAKDFNVTVPQPLFETGITSTQNNHPYVATRDGQRFLVPVTDQSAASQMTVVLNWLAGVQR